MFIWIIVMINNVMINIMMRKLRVGLLLIRRKKRIRVFVLRIHASNSFIPSFVY